MPENKSSNPHSWLERKTGRHFLLKDENGEKKLVENSQEALTEEHKKLLDKLVDAGLLAGEEKTSDDKVIIDVPQGTVPLSVLNEDYRNNFENEIHAVADKAAKLTGLPEDIILSHLVHLNFVEEGENSIKVFPSVVDEIDLISGVGSVALGGE